jgi:hypothetical protein
MIGEPCGVVKVNRTSRRSHPLEKREFGGNRGPSPVPAWLGSFGKRSKSTKAPCGQSGFGTSLGGHGTRALPTGQAPSLARCAEAPLESFRRTPGPGSASYPSESGPGRGSITDSGATTALLMGPLIPQGGTARNLRRRPTHCHGLPLLFGLTALCYTD